MNTYRALQTVAVLGVMLATGCIPTGEPAQTTEGQPAPTPESAEVAAEPQTPMLLPDSEEEPVPAEEPAPIEEEPASPEALIAEWEALAEDPLINMGKPRVLEIAAALNEHGVEHLNPVLDLLANPDASKEHHVFALVTLQHVVSPAMKDRLIAIATESQNARTQGIAIQLLGQLEDPSLRPVLEKFAESDQEFVRFPALQGLAKLGSESAQDTLLTMFNEAQGNWPLQDRVVQTLALTPSPKHEDMFITAAGDQMLENRSRQVALLALGEIGDAETIARLEAMKTDTMPKYEADLADQAIARIRERHNLEAEAPASAEPESETPQ